MLNMQKGPELQQVLVVLAHHVIGGGKRLGGRGKISRKGVGLPSQPSNTGHSCLVVTFITPPLPAAIGASSSESDESELSESSGRESSSKSALSTASSPLPMR